MASGPSTKQQATGQQTAPMPGLYNPLQNLLQGVLGGQNPFAQSYQPSALQQQAGASYQNAVTNQSNGLQDLMGKLNSGYGGIMNSNSYQGILDASQPVFQRNMQMGADTLRQAGPRFNSNTERLVGQQGQQAMQDYNLFANQAFQQSQQNQLGAMNGLAQGTLGGYNSMGNLLSGFGNYANQQAGQGLQQNQMNNQILSQLLGIAGGLGAGTPIYQQDPGWFSQLLKLGSAGANIYGASQMGGMGGMGVGQSMQNDAYNAGQAAGGAFQNGGNGTVGGTAPIGAGGVQYNPGNPNANYQVMPGTNMGMPSQPQSAGGGSPWSQFFGNMRPMNQGIMR